MWYLNLSSNHQILMKQISGAPGWYSTNMDPWMLASIKDTYSFFQHFWKWNMAPLETMVNTCVDLTVHYGQWIYHQQNKTTKLSKLRKNDACHTCLPHNQPPSPYRTIRIEAGQGIFPRCSTSSKRWTKWFQSWPRASCWELVMKWWSYRWRSRWPSPHSSPPQKKNPKVVYCTHIY